MSWRSVAATLALVVVTLLAVLFLLRHTLRDDPECLGFVCPMSSISEAPGG